MPQTTEETPAPHRPAPPRITPAQWALLMVLAAINFTHCVDFVIMMPLGPRYQRDLKISIRDFGVLVESYGYSAAASALLAAFLVDRFDRKRALLLLYGGLVVGTLGCALAPNFQALLVARCVAGASGGVLGAIVLSIIGDVFPEERRGLATGVVMSAFSVALIVGVPAGLCAAQLGTTGTPFAVLAALGAACWLAAVYLLPPLNAHRANPFDTARQAPWRVLLVPEHLWAYVLMVSLVLGSFTLVPYLPTFLRENTGMDEQFLPLLYLCGGVATFWTTSTFGRLADRYGKLRVYRVVALLMLVPVLVLTNLGQTPVAVTLAVTTLFMVMSSGRMVPAMALVTSSARPAYRGSFMSVNIAVQQIALGLATSLASLFLYQEHKDAPVEGYPVVGLIACATTLVSIVLAGRLRPVGEKGIGSKGAVGPTAAEECRDVPAVADSSKAIKAIKAINDSVSP
jgi:predicted MFS family arabinose efflux permease